MWFLTVCNICDYTTQTTERNGIVSRRRYLDAIILQLSIRIVILTRILSDPAALTRPKRVFDRVRGRPTNTIPVRSRASTEDTGVTNKVVPSGERRNRISLIAQMFIAIAHATFPLKPVYRIGKRTAFRAFERLTFFVALFAANFQRLQSRF